MMESLKELLYNFGSFCAGLVKRGAEWFMGLSLFNKLIVLNTFFSFLAITLPIGRYYIFETWFDINNPLAVYLILIVIIMFSTIFFHGPAVAGGRIIVNLWYLISVIVMFATHSFSRAPYEISAGFLFNLVAPLVYLALSVMIYMTGDN